MNTPYGSNDRVVLLEKVFEGKAGLDYLRSLQGPVAEGALGLMQMELDAPISKFDAGKVVKAMKTLSSHSGEFPPTYWLRDVKCGEHAVELGGNGDVYKGAWRDQLVAVKFARYYQPEERGNTDNATMFKQFCHEVFLWRRLSHPNILPFLGLYKDGPKHAMVSKWQHNGNLTKFLEKNPDVDRYDLLVQATNGLAYLHDQKPSVVHMDLKPENILISETYKAMLADFGCSRMKHDLSGGWTSTAIGYTKRYVSPEVLKENTEVTVHSDIWSLGMVVFTVFTGKLPYMRECPKGAECYILIQEATPPQRPLFSMTDKSRGLTDDVWAFLEQYCWAKTERHRPLARDCSKRLEELKDRWLSKKAPTIPAICLPVVPKYVRDKSQLYSKMERFGIKLQVHEDLARLKLQGEEENVLAAKAEIISDIDTLKDKCSQTVPIPTRFHASLIGGGGESVKAMEQKHSVRIRFDSKEGTAEIEGASDDVSKARDELRSDVESRQCLDDFLEIEVTNTVSTHVQYNRKEISYQLKLRELKSPAGAVVYMRGPKDSLKAGQKYLRRLQKYFDKEVTEAIEGEANLLQKIFKDSSWLDIVTECGGPSDPVMQKRLVIAPLTDGEQFSLRAVPELLHKLKCALKLEVERRRKIVIGVEIPQDLHRSLLYEHGIKDLQQATGASIYFPRSNSYSKFDPENSLELTDNSQDIVKIHGTRQCCDNAKRELMKRIEQEHRLRHKIPVSPRLHDKTRELVFRTLKASDIEIESLPPQPVIPLDDNYSTPLPLTSTEPSWERYNIYRNEHVENLECTWLLRAKTEADLESALATVGTIIQDEMHNSWKGLLTFPTNSAFGRIVGTQGETVKRLEEMTKTQIRVPKAGEGTTITIFGPRRGLDRAKDIIAQLGSAWKTVSNE